MAESRWNAGQVIDALEVPPLVARALRVSFERGYVEATRSETGKLLATLAATTNGTIGESGTGCGVATAWLRTGAPASTRVVTADPDPELAEVARGVLSSANVTVLTSDWTGLRGDAPYALVFLDSREAQQVSRDDVLSILEERGLVVIDDFPAPTSLAWRTPDQRDYLRQEWLSDERFESVEIAVADDTTVVLAARRTSA